MSSTSANARRKPQQSRATRRRETFLDVAANLIADHGYEAVTMTAIAEEAGASIGTLYDYFPDKPALASALKSQYIKEIDKRWKVLLDSSSSLSEAALASVLVEGALSLVRDWPAYLVLLDAPVGYARSAAARRPLRKTIASALQSVNPSVSDGKAFMNALVIVELMKSLLSVRRHCAARENDTVAEEFKKLMRFYIVEALK